MIRHELLETVGFRNELTRDGYSEKSILYLLDRFGKSYDHFISIWNQFEIYLSTSNVDTRYLLGQLDSLTERFLVALSCESLPYLQNDWPEPENGTVDTVQLSKQLFGYLLPHWHISERSVGLLKMILEKKIQTPSLTFEEIFLESFPETELPMIAEIVDGKLHLENKVKRTSFLEIFLRMYAIPDTYEGKKSSVSLDSDEENQLYWLHISRVSFNPFEQAIKTHRDFITLLEGGFFEKGWPIVGISHLLGERSNALSKVLEKRFKIPKEKITLINNIDPIVAGNGSTENLPPYLTPEYIVSVAFLNLSLSPKYVTEYVFEGKLPKLGFIHFPSEEINYNNPNTKAIENSEAS